MSSIPGNGRPTETTVQTPKATRHASMKSRAALSLAAATTVGTAAWLSELSRHVSSGNSDGATVVLEGQAISSGHLFLSGWSLSLDSFWTVDALFYALAVRLFGLRAGLLSVVPGVIAALVILVSAYIASDRRQEPEGLIGVVVILGVLAFPSRAMALFLLQGPLHVATLLWCLLAFVSVASGRRVGWMVCAVLIAAGILGDLQTLILGAAPLAATGLCLSYFSGRWREGVPLVSAPIVGGALALVVREIAKTLGSFAIPRANTFASGHQLIFNVAHLPARLLALLGVIAGPYGPTGLPPALQVLHVIAVIVVIGGPAVVVVRLVTMLWRPPGRVGARSTTAVVDYLLAFGFIGDIATFVLLPITTSDGYARYLVCGVVFGAVLGARLMVRWVAGKSAATLRAVLVAVVGVAAVYGAGLALEFRGGPATNPAAELSRFLISHGLDHGVGDYWSASIVTVDSGGTVDVRPIIAEADGRLVRYEKQSASSWYGATPFHFVVFNRAVPWNGVDALAARRTFGRPRVIYSVDTYEVMVWSRPIIVSVNGSTGP